MSMNNSDDKDTLGVAANRYVTFQIVSAIIGGIIFLIMLFAFFLPMFNHVNQGPSFSSSGMQVTPITPGGPGTDTVTVDGRPATPAEKAMIEQQINQAPSQPSGSQSPAGSSR